MDNQRLFLWGSLLLIYFLVYQAWMTDYAPRPPADTAPPAASAPPAAGTEDLPSAEDLPTLPGDLPQAAPPGAADAPTAVAEAPPAPATISVRTDVLHLELSLTGADIVSAVLPAYPRRKDQPDIKVQLLNPTPSDLYAFQTGFLGGTDTDAPDHRDTYTADARSYELAEGDDVIEVPFRWTAPAGTTVRKVYTLKRGEYGVALRYEVDNQSAQPWNAASYVQIKRRHKPIERSMVSVETYSFRGPVLYDGDSYEKLDIDDLVDEPININTANGWIAAIQHHFLTAAVPSAGTVQQYQARVIDDSYLLSAVGPVTTVAPGQQTVFEETLFVGPKLQKQLKGISSDLALTVDYGFLTPISQPIFWVMQKIHDVVGNWGWTIILLTILIKLIFYKLTETSGKSMAKMRKLQPRIKALQERYKEDRQKLSEAMLKLYREEKANPAAGCLPILVQMPVFLALYWVLLESVELRQAPWMLWIQDLSVRDPFFILPALMAASMFVQQKLNPAPPDPIQAKVMMIMPLALSVFMAFFPAGLVLYWFVNTLLSVLQQWRINTVIERTG